jgi:SMI1 / KNR4 family (SUKH-1)
MEHKDQLIRIQSKLGRLATQDPNNTIFGAASHKYALNAPKKEAELAFFEKQHGIQLPSGYRAFLLVVCNGSAGPYYGMQRFESSRNDDLDKPSPERLLDPSKPFPHTDAWNVKAGELSPEEQGKFDEDYFDPKWASGLLRIANYGCGVFINLVVHGPSKGQMWVDDRCNGNGIFPDQMFGNVERIGFLDWYELWLDQSLAELRKLPPVDPVGQRAPAG